MKTLKKLLFSLMTMLLVLSVTAGIAFAAWSYKQEFEIADPTGTDRENLVVFTGINASALIDAGFMNSTGNNTNIQLGSANVTYMFSDNDTLIYIADLGSNERQDYDLYLDYTPQKENFDILIGNGGYVRTPDDADLELGDDFRIEWRGYLDTTAGSNKYLVYKEDAIAIYVDNTTSGTIKADIYQDSYGWFSPASFTDPDTAWTNEANAYDDNVTSNTSTDGSGFLYLTPSGNQRVCDKVRVYASANNGTSDVDPHIELYVENNDEIWYYAYNSTVTRGQWNTINFSSNVTLTDAKIKITGGNSTDNWLNEFDYYATDAPVQLEVTGISSGEHMVRVISDGDMCYLTVNTLYGSGTAESPYFIYDVDDLQEVSDNLSAYYILMNNIDASETSTWNAGAGFDPIGESGTPFTGYFDSRGYEITDLTINRSSENNVGLFGFTSGATINNVYLDSCDITGDGNTGSLIGWAENTIVNNCHSRWGTVNGTDDVGGLIGYLRTELGNSTSNVTYSSTTLDVYAYEGLSAGFIGFISHDQGYANQSINIEHCYSSGTMYAYGNYEEDYAGFIGRTAGKDGTSGNPNTIDIRHCYNFGDMYVYGNNILNSGGFFGLNAAYNISYYHLTFEDCCNSGDIYIEGTDCNSFGGFGSSFQRDTSGEVDTETNLIRCYNTGDIYGAGEDELFCAGGFAFAFAGNVTDCYSTGDVRSWTDPNGFAVATFNEAGTTITNCYSSGRALQYSDNIEADYYYVNTPQGFIGTINYGDEVLTACFWDIETSGIAKSNSGTGLTSMAHSSNLSVMATAGFDFSDDGEWEVIQGNLTVNDGLPILKNGVCACDSFFDYTRSVPDNTNYWYFMYGTTAIYSEILTIDIDGSRELTYQPVALILNDTLPDETNDHDGTVFWGTNPNVTVTIGDFITPEDEPTPEDPIDPYVAPDDWIQECVYLGELTPEIKEIINTAATDIGMSDPCSLWMIIIFGSTCAIALGVQVFTGSMLITGTTMVALLGFGSKVGIVSGGFVLIIAITVFAIMYLLRHN